MKTRFKEIGKNILIVLLICSLLLLTLIAMPTRSVSAIPWLSQLLQPMVPLLGLPEAELTYVAQAEPVPNGAQPIAISVHSDLGRHTALWDFSALDAAFSVFSPVLTQVMDHADSFRPASQYQIETALSGNSVYFRYASPIPMSLVASWLNSRLQAPLENVLSCIVSAQGGCLSLYLLSEEEAYLCDTTLTDSLLLPLLQSYEADGSAFAYESQYPLDPLSLLPAKATVPAVSYAIPDDSRYAEELATSLGFNPYAETRYTDDRGTNCFNETGASLQITADGYVILLEENARFTADTTEPEALAEAARKLTNTITGNLAGDNRLYLTAMTQSDDTTICEFDYFVGGIRVQLSEPTATVHFSGTAVIQARVQLYSFSGTGKSEYPLPIAQAAAVLTSGSRLELAYHPDADGSLTAGWCR